MVATSFVAQQKNASLFYSPPGKQSELHKITLVLSHSFACILCHRFTSLLTWVCRGRFSSIHSVGGFGVLLIYYRRFAGGVEFGIAIPSAFGFYWRFRCDAMAVLQRSARNNLGPIVAEPFTR